MASCVSSADAGTAAISIAAAKAPNQTDRQPAGFLCGDDNPDFNAIDTSSAARLPLKKSAPRSNHVSAGDATINGRLRIEWGWE